MRLGHANVDALARSLTAKQFAAWEHYAQLDPFSERRADYRAASIVQMLANIHRGQKQQAYSLQDFLLEFEVEEKPAQTWQEKLAIAKMWAMVQNAGVPEIET